MENAYTPRQRHALLIVALVALLALAVLGLLPYLTAFWGAGILYVVFRPWFAALVHRRGWNRRLVTLLLLVLAVVLIIVPFFALTALLVDRLRELPQYTDQALAVVHRLEARTGIEVLGQDSSLRTLLQKGASQVSRWLPTLASGLLNASVVVGLMLFTLYYLYMQEEAFLAGLRRYLPFRPHTQAELGESLKNNVNANVLGQALVALVQAGLTGLLLWGFGVPQPAFWGVVAFFMAFIPVLGTPLVWGPAALYQLSQGAVGAGVGILVVGTVVVMNVDNLLRIVLAKKLGNIHPWVTLVGLVLGVELFGIVGLVVGPLLLSYLLVLMAVFERENKVLKALAAADDAIAQADAAG